MTAADRSPDSDRKVIFVAPRLAGECLRAAHAAQQLDDVTLLAICQHPCQADAPLADSVCVDNVHDADQLTTAARQLVQRHGKIAHIVTVHESLLQAAAIAGEATGAACIDVATVQRVLDKSQLKAALGRGGVATAAHCLATSGAQAQDFAGRHGFPLVLKPLAGGGGLGTWQARSAPELELALDLLAPRDDCPIVVERHLRGQELCLDTITINNEPQFHSICCYRPTILDALDDAAIQWSCVMPRDIDGPEHRRFIEQGLAAARALQVGNAMTHMEGFLTDDGNVMFTDATLRPAGARIGPMLAFAYDLDPYRAWARAAIDGAFDGPWKRTHAVATIFLRGAGQGKVASVEGAEAVEDVLGPLIVDSRLPLPGNPKAVTYTGDGYITVRHPETQAVLDAIELIRETLRIRYTGSDQPAAPHSSLRDRWSQRLRHLSQQRYQPTWDDDSLPRFGEKQSIE